MTAHKSVLLQEVIEGLNLKKGDVVLDGTFGGGGHSKAICEKFDGVKIVALDQDKSTWHRAKDNFKGCDITFLNKNFRDLDEVLAEKELGKVNGIVLDLGLSSDQLEDSGRGFSFMKDEPLYMTMKDQGDNLPSPEDLTASDIVNSWGEENLADIIYGYGEEKYSRVIARAIVEARKEKKIETTFDLVKIIEDCVGRKYAKERIHPATRTFQALRIAVNDELGTLAAGLKKGWAALAVGGRMEVITFHSLEDRIAKRFYQAKAKEGEGQLINKKPIIPSEDELRDNKRARSAKLRIIEKIK